jgi:hypothetical protein
MKVKEYIESLYAGEPEATGLIQGTMNGLLRDGQFSEKWFRRDIEGSGVAKSGGFPYFELGNYRYYLTRYRHGYGYMSWWEWKGLRDETELEARDEVKAR